MKSITVEGVVIKRANLGEADKIITLFTKDQGKITAVARGVRKLSSKRAGLLELFNLIRAQVIQGRGSMDTLAEVQTINTFSAWRKHLGRVNLAYQMCEAVDKLTADRQPQSQVFTILVTGLSQIGVLGDNWQSQMRTWLVGIAEELGFWSKDKKFIGDILEFVETTSSRPFNSPKLLNRMR